MRLFKNLKALVLLLVVGVLIVTAVAFMFFTRQEVERAMLEAGRQSARNVLHAVDLNIENEYKSLQFFKEYALAKYKDQLKNLIAVVVSNIDYFYEISAQGLILEEEARRLALESVQKLRYGKNDYFFIYDENHIAISHPDPHILGRDMSEYKDLKGQSVIKTMWEETGKHGEGFSTFWWPRLGEDRPVKKLTYFIHYPKWNWLIGTGLFIDDVEADAEKKLASVMDLLRDTFAKTRVAETGYFWVFNGRRQILIHPTLSDIDASRLKDPVTGHDLLERLIRASRSPDRPWEFLWDKPTRPGEYVFPKEAYVAHFEPLDWYVASSVYKDEMRAPAEAIIRRQALFVGVVVCICVIVAFILVTGVTRPLKKLTGHAVGLAENDFSPSEHGAAELLSIRFPNEVGRLASTMFTMEQRLQEYIKDLTETTAAQERMQSELRIAHDIQMSMLPDGTEQSFSEQNVAVAAKLIPAKEIGGDFYDYFLIDDERLCFLVGDVADKGIPASLFMALSKALIRATTTFVRTTAREGLSPDEVLSRVNPQLCQGNDLCMFVTVFLAVLDMRTGQVVYTNGGHNPPYLLQAGGGCTEISLPPGRPLGLSQKATYESRQIQLSPGQGLFVYTDGITEAMNSKGEFFSEARLQRLLSNLGGLRPGPLVERIVQEVEAFSRSVVLADDISALTIRYDK